MFDHDPRFRGIRTTSQRRLTRLSLALGRIRIAVALVVAVTAGLAVSSRIARLQTRDESLPAKNVTIHATGKGGSLIHLKDGYELSARVGKDARANAAAQPSLGSPLSVASADFDEDGVPDLVTGYAGGKLALYRGNVDSIYPNSREAQQRKATGQFTDEAFLPDAQVFDVPESPDVIQAGDFNADGHKDVLVSARGSNSIYLLSGTGKGTFKAAQRITVNGQVTAMVTGEIGQADGQTDVAIAVTNSKGSQLLVFEHPEGAFKHPPEVFPLPAPATDIVLGDLDGDHYSDIAVATGDVLTIIHERGLAYPWDMVKGMDIQRPPAIVETRTMPFMIAGLAIGEFGNQRVNSLAMLSADGSLYTLEPTAPKTSNRVLSAANQAQTTSSKFTPTGADAKSFALKADMFIDAKALQASGVMNPDSWQPGADMKEQIKKTAGDAEAQTSKLSKAESVKLKAATKAQADATRELAKKAFLETISAHPSSLSKWNLQPIVTAARVSASGVSAAGRLITARISVSSKDDLVVVDSANRQVNIVAQSVPPVVAGGSVSTSQVQTPRAEITSLDLEGSPTAVLPMRLNSDALSDLVVMRSGAAQPSIVMTTSASTFTVNDAGDQNSSCSPTDPTVTCTLRGAIEAANLAPGSTIAFNIPGGGVQTISPFSELPIVLNSVTIDGTTQPGYSGAPLVEIKGNNFSAGQAIDGLKIRASNCVVRGLAINEFPSFQDPDTGSLVGGNGLTVESTTLSPNNGNNIIQGNYLGTDPSGTLDKGNTATGLNVFASDNNTIGGTTAGARNVISGNGSPSIPGAGLSLTTSNNNMIQGNNIGTTADGKSKLGNSEGVFLTGSNNQFGGDDAGAANTVSGNGEPRPPASPVPGCDGVGMNVLALFDVNSGALLTQLNLIKGNRIGTDPTGTKPLGNCSMGIITEPQVATVIGSITPNGRNLVSDNGDDGIWCAELNFTQGATQGGFCFIAGNNVGSDITGTIPMGNTTINGNPDLQLATASVTLYNNFSLSNVGGPGGTTVGGDCTGFCNLISGQATGNGTAKAYREVWGLLVEGSGTIGVYNNYVGTDVHGAKAIPNDEGVGAFSISTTFPTIFIGGIGTDQNNQEISLGNLISGNQAEPNPGLNGIGIDTGGDGLFSIQGNLIGTDAGGINALPNGDGQDQNTNGGITGGIWLHAGSAIYSIGGVDPYARNVISGNNGGGIVDLGAPSFGEISILNNFIGVNNLNQPLANTGVGITVGTGSATIGGTTAAEANVIQNNGSAGILVSNWNPPIYASGVDIEGNSIKDNAGLGIDLSLTASPDGVTPNDCQDADVGPNELQNFPVLAAAIFNGDGTVTVPASLSSEPLRDYRIDFYYSTSADPTNYGEGENFIGSQSVTTNGDGFVGFDFTSTTPVPAGSVITATATNQNGSTSEFSCAAGVCVGQSGKNGQSSKNDPFDPPPPASCPLKDIVVNVTSDESEDPGSQGQVCNVDPNATQGNEKCTLRAAIQEAIYRSAHQLGRWTIKFNIPATDSNCNGATLVCTISPASALDAITQPVTIDGTTQPGYTESVLSSTYSPVIEVSGANIAGSSANGLDFQSGSGGSVAALVINRFGNREISVVNSDGLSVQKCYLGINPDGISAPASQGTVGVYLQSSKNIHIGDFTMVNGKFTHFNGNVISNNSSSGVSIESCESCDVTSNLIGTDKSGMTALPNLYGVSLEGQLTGHGSIGGNVISGNTLDGVIVQNTQGGGDGVLLSANLIGPRADRTGNLGHGPSGDISGIRILASSGVELHGNVIVGYTNNDSGSQNSGIFISDTDGTAIEGNYIGVTQSGVKTPNGYGIILKNSSNSQIGEFANFTRNVIAGNTEAGIYIYTTGVVTGNKILRNYIGVFGNADRVLNRDIPQALGNGKQGIWVKDQVQATLIDSNTIAGNGAEGILISRAESGTGLGTIQNNKIGTPAANGNSAIPNNIGIRITGSTQNKILNNTFDSNLVLGALIGAVPNFPDSGNGARKLGQLSPLAVPPAATEENIFQGNGFQNSQVGMAITEGASNNAVGLASDGTGSGNNFSGNNVGVGYGIFLGSTINNPDVASLPSGNTVFGNSFNQNTVGMAISQAQNNTVGGDFVRTVGGQNQKYGANDFSGNSADGLRLSGENTQGNMIVFNEFGTGPFLGNGGNGIFITDTARNDIKNNIIGYNKGNGISISNITTLAQTDFAAVISGNQIGALTASGGNTVNIGNTQAGIRISNVQNLLIGVDGVTSSEPKNIIGCNGADGISILGSSSKFIKITNSVIGTNSSGGAGFGNGGNGIFVSGSDNTIGGNQTVGNVISGNQQNGILMQSSDRNSILGNSIGVVTNANGTNVPLPNGGSGIVVADSQQNNIGASGILFTYSNIIGGNAADGILVSGVRSSSTTISKNLIGTDSSDANLANGLNGVHITNSASHNFVGGSDDINAGNTIAHNAGKGVFIDDTALCCNLIDPNSIYGNGGLGIGLGNSDSPLPNDSGDGDSGPNNLQNYPEFISALLIPGDKLVITYKVDSAPANSNYGSNGLYVEIFKADSALQGQTFITSANYATTNYTAGMPGPAILTISNASSFGIQTGDKLVATATDADGNTSEFTSTNVGVVVGSPTAADGNIGGKITDASGAAISGVTITLDGTQTRETITDAQGNYSFDAVETNGFYTLTPSCADYTFTPANRSFSLLGAHTEASFTAAANGDHANAIDTTEFFVRQQYLDFLGREPDPPGFIGWVNTIKNCSAGDTSCDRVHVSEMFFRSQEFQQRGYFIYRFCSSAFGRKPDYTEFTPDLARVSGFLTNDQLEAAKVAFANDFVNRPAFAAQYGSLSNPAYVDALTNTATVALLNRQTLIDSLNAGALTRAQVLRQIAESGEVYQKYYNQAFVVMEYFGYLRRDPDALYLNWIQVLDLNPADSRHMVEGFVNSTEYRNRFTQ